MKIYALKNIMVLLTILFTPIAMLKSMNMPSSQEHMSVVLSDSASESSDESLSSVSDDELDDLAIADDTSNTMTNNPALLATVTHNSSQAASIERLTDDAALPLFLLGVGIACFRWFGCDNMICAALCIMCALPYAKKAQAAAQIKAQELKVLGQAKIEELQALGQAKVEAKIEEVKALAVANVAAGQAKVDAQVAAVKIKALEYAKTGAVVAAGSVALYYGYKFVSSKIQEARRIPCLAYASSEQPIAKQVVSMFSESDPVQSVDIILSTDTAAQFKQIVATIKNNSAQSGSQESVNFRNLLLAGPSGTGKSMFAHNLAIASGIDYYMFKAADLLNEQGNHATHTFQALMTWAETKTAKGKLIFIEDAELLIAQKDVMAIRNFLSYARTGSVRSMFVFSTNKPEIDSMLNYCAEDVVIFALPSMHDRIAIIDHYINIYMLHDGIVPEYRDSVLAVLQQDKIAQIASATEEFSGEDLKNYIKTIVSFTTSSSTVITHEIVDEALQQAISKHARFAKINA